MEARVLTPTAGMEREEWLRQRRRGIGGSDAAAILGLHPFSSPVEVWAEKTGRTREQPENEAMWLGRAMEEHVAQRFAQESGVKIARRNAILQHPNYPWMLANIDRRIVGERAGLEVKTTSPWNKTRFDRGDIPAHYYIQCMHYLAVTGWDYWMLAVYVFGRGLNVFRVDRDADEIDSLIASERRFWEQNVLVDVLPDFDGSKTAQQVLNETYPQAVKDCVMIVGAEDDCEAYLKLDEQIKALEKQRDAHKQRLMSLVGNAQVGECIDYTVKWSNVAGKAAFDARRLQKDLPEIYQQYTKVGAPTRRFSIKKKEA